MAIVQIQLDDEIFAKAQSIAGTRGMDLEKAIQLFVGEMIHRNDLPFEPLSDPFYGKSNIEHLKCALADLKAGKKLSQHELIED